MTKLTYEYKDNFGRVTEVKTYPEAVALVEAKGGHFSAKYTPIPEPSAKFPVIRDKRGVTIKIYNPNLR